MKIAAASLTDPARNGPYAVAALALSVFVFAYSTRFGPIAVLGFYAVWLPLMIAPLHALWHDPWRIGLILLLPILATASCLWSDRPEATLRAGLQYGSTVLPGLIAARALSPRSLSLGLMWGGLAVLTYSQIRGAYAYDVVDGSFAFAGAFESKNQLGLFASLTLIAALHPLARITRGDGPLALPSLAIAAFAAVTLARTQSATSVITVTLALAVMGLSAALMRQDRLLRLALLALLLGLGVAGVLAALRLGALDVLFAVFGKDQTLTGRTYLWSRGIEFGNRFPGLGLGYCAFWLPGRAGAEELWAEFHIGSASGFHFHNTLIEGYVGLGLTGVALLAAWSLGLLLLPGLLMLRETPAPAVALIGLSVLFLVRSLVEIDFFTPYTAGSFLVPCLLLMLLDHAMAPAGHRPSAPQRGTDAPAARFAGAGAAFPAVTPAHPVPPSGPNRR